MATTKKFPWRTTGIVALIGLGLWAVWYFLMKEEKLTPGNASYVLDKEDIDDVANQGKNNDRDVMMASVQPGRNVTVVNGHPIAERRSGSTQRKINQCYIWTSLTMEQCIDKYM